MTAKMTDKEKFNLIKTALKESPTLYNGETFSELFRAIAEVGGTIGFEVAESIYLPQIQQLQGEIERLMLVNDRLMQERNNVLNIKTTDGLTASEWVQRTANAEEKIAQLTAKHEKMVKGLKEIPIYDKKEMDWAVDGTKWILKYSIDNLLTESEDK